MRVPRTSHNGKSIGILIVSVMGTTTKVNQPIEIAKTMIHGANVSIVVEVESPTVASTDTSHPNVLSREPMTFRGLKRTSDIISIHTAIRLIKVPRAVSLIVVGSTGKKFDLLSAVPGAVSARLQAGCAAPTASAPTATGLKSSIQSVVLREVKTYRPHRPSGSPHRFRTDEEIDGEDFRDVRRRLSPVKTRTSHQAHHDQPPIDTRTRISPRDAERSLRKIRSEARILLSKISEPEDESMEAAVRRSATFKDHKPAGLCVPSSATSLTGDTSPERPRLSAKEKGKGRASATTFEQSGVQHPTRPHRPVAETGREHHVDRASKSERRRPTAWDKEKAKELVREQSDVPRSTRTSNQQHAARSQQPTAERAGEHQCDWKDKYNNLKTEIEDGRQGQDAGAAEVGQDHQCDWKEKYLGLKSEVEADGGQQADLGLEGLTIVLHMRGKDDLIVNTDLRELDQK
ncbi:hypothetical protein INS49_005698 [Diaporthe citri]|uniref:uncharacterized protein n=1 Tax=Diaporthe citri TaxID=83186 RepID=UPI001C819F41|nr:uncharacterized protein INS49_005698 [Diaporthe citri]KAG6364100.1 hypothetical protein INS49_005698 [Diaporthe citri]